MGVCPVLFIFKCFPYREICVESESMIAEGNKMASHSDVFPFKFKLSCRNLPPIHFINVFNSQMRCLAVKWRVFILKMVLSNDVGTSPPAQLVLSKSSQKWKRQICNGQITVIFSANDLKQYINLEATYPPNFIEIGHKRDNNGFNGQITYFLLKNGLKQ